MDFPRLLHLGQSQYNAAMGRMTQNVHEAAQITTTDGTCGGKPHIAGTRIRVQDIYVWHELQGRSPDEIVSAYPQLTLASVYAALSYFWDHREAILQQIKQEEAMVEQMKPQHPSKLPKSAQVGGKGDAVSS